MMDQNRKMTDLQRRMKEQNATITSMKQQISQQKKNIKHLEEKKEALQKKIKTLNETKPEKKRRCTAYSDIDTGLKENNRWDCVISLLLPQQAGRYLCRYSFTGYAIDYKLNLGDKNLLKQDGLYLFEKNTRNNGGLPLSGSVVVKLNGNENVNARKLGLYHYGSAQWPSGIQQPCIECIKL